MRCLIGSMIKQIIEMKEVIFGLSDNGELYYMAGDNWSHICSSPDDREKPYIKDGKWTKKSLPES
jgi:hypothetical protein